MSPPLAAATIAAKQTLPLARVVASSFRDHHPDVPFFVLLADEVDGYFDPSAEPYELLRLCDLELSGEAAFRFVHTQQELSYALTPYLIEKLLELGYDSALFIKQESFVLGDLATIAHALEPGEVALTPHLLEPLTDESADERELMILLAGVFNSGLVAVRAGDESARLLRWWQDRLRAECRYAVAVGIHYEQRWLDLAPAYFEGIRLVRDRRVNVGHWNLPERLDPHGEYRLFRFSGYDADDPEAATRYTPRVRTAELGRAAAIFERYRRALLDAGWEPAKRWPYAYGTFDTGVPIPDVARRLYRTLHGHEAVGNPFGEAFLAWLQEGSPNRLWQHIHRERPDLQRAFPQPQGRDRRRFLAWARSHGVAEYVLPEALQ
jgi:hypothetical protein